MQMVCAHYAAVRVVTLMMFVMLAVPSLKAGEVPATPAMATAPTTPAVEELEELDEVVVRGERLIDTIVKAEDEFYKLYNALNKDQDYDVNCPHLNLGADAGSRIRSRLCLPGFVASAIADFVAFQVSCEPKFAHFDANRDGRVSRSEAGANADLQYQFDALDRNGDDRLEEYGEFRSFETWALMNLSCYRPPPPELVLMEGTDKWFRHMMQVTNSDPRLLEMAGRLDELHQELGLVQRRYREVVDAERAQDARKAPDMKRAGPRPR
jgi:hypothetical protein